MNIIKEQKVIITFFSILFLLYIFFLSYRYFENDKIFVEKISKQEELQNIFNDSSKEQINFYFEIANEGHEGSEKCHGRPDEKNCLMSTAVIKEDKNLCHFHLENGDGDALEMECHKAVLKKTVEREVNKCILLDNDDYFNCIREVFDAYGNIDECEDVKGTREIKLCEDVLNYELAYLHYDRYMCDNIKDNKLNKYCLKNIIDKKQDSDSDGLTDLDEINIHKTNYKGLDSDNDSLSDYDEIFKYRTNPLKKDSKENGYGDGVQKYVK